jgi:hypothetical protein
MADTVQRTLEQMIPELEDLQIAGVFSKVKILQKNITLAVNIFTTKIINFFVQPKSESRSNPLSLTGRNQSHRTKTKRFRICY